MLSIIICAIYIGWLIFSTLKFYKAYDENNMRKLILWATILIMSVR